MALRVEKTRQLIRFFNSKFSDVRITFDFSVKIFITSNKVMPDKRFSFQEKNYGMKISFIQTKNIGA